MWTTVTKGTKRGDRDWIGCGTKGSPLLETMHCACSSAQVTWLLEVKGNTIALRAQDQLRTWGVFQSYLTWMLNASSCYQYKWKFPSPYDIFSCCDSCLKSVIFLNSPVHPGGLRLTNQKGKWECGGYNYVRRKPKHQASQINRVLLTQSIVILSKCSNLSHDTVLVVRNKT